MIKRMIFGPLHQWTKRKALIEADARALINWFGDDGAYVEAQRRARDESRVIGGVRPSGHWEDVRHRVLQLVKQCGRRPLS
jgi:SH3-like domain-containing protein